MGLFRFNLDQLCHQTPPLFALWQCQSQGWIKKEGEANHFCYDAVSLNGNSPPCINRSLFNDILVSTFETIAQVFDTQARA